MWEKAAFFRPKMRHTAEKLSADIPISRFPDFDIPIQHSTLPFVLASSMAVLADS